MRCTPRGISPRPSSTPPRLRLSPLTEKTSTTENATRSSSNSWFTDALYTQLLNQLQEDLNYTADEAKGLIFRRSAHASHRYPHRAGGHENTMY